MQKGEKLARITIKHFAEVLDTVEAPYILEIYRPPVVEIEDGKIRTVGYNPFSAVRPLEESDLFFSFAKLAARGKPSEKRIKSWVSRFGLPKSEPNYAGMSVEKFRNEAQRAHELLDLYSDIREGNAEAIAAKVKNPTWGSSLAQVFREKFEASWNKPGLREVHRDSKTVVAAQAALGELTTELVSRVRLRIGVQRGEGLVPSWECPDLLSEVYLQFYLLVTEHKPLKHCTNCGQPFEATRPDRNFCSASCRSGHRYKRRRQKLTRDD